MMLGQMPGMPPMGMQMPMATPQMLSGMPPAMPGAMAGAMPGALPGARGRGPDLAPRLGWSGLGPSRLGFGVAWPRLGPACEDAVKIRAGPRRLARPGPARLWARALGMS